MINADREKKLLSVLQKMIRFRSYSGEEGKLTAYLKTVFEENGYDSVHIDSLGNIIGCIKGNRPGPKILFDGHMDTVPVFEDQWTENPYGGDIKEGKVYGRGATDMKGALATMIMSVAYFAEDCKKDFAGSLYVAGVVHEECFEGVASREISKYVQPDIVIIGEPSELNLKIGQRGRGEIVVETYGKPAHSANPHKGINAVYLMAELINRVRNIKLEEHPELGLGILELTDIKSSPYPGASVVPSHCRATYDRRLLVGETKESVIKPIQDIINQMSKENPQFSAKVSYAEGAEKCFTGNEIISERFFPGWLYEREEEFVQTAYEALKEAGLSPEITHYSFCTNGSHYGGEAGIKTIGFGPSYEHLAHINDEYIEIDQLNKALKGYYAITKAYTK